MRVRQGKGAKDGYTVLSLRQYWKNAASADLAVPSTEPDQHIQAYSIRHICRDANRSAGISKHITPRMLRQL